LSNQIKPNFLIVGAAKSGTTSLYQYIRKHPNIYMPPEKEPMFFVSDIYKKISRNDPRHHIADRAVVSDFDSYLQLFDHSETGVKKCGEASAAYLYHYETAIPKIKKYLGEIKIIIILRNPVDRAFSSYSHLLRDGAEFSSFDEFLEQEEKRKEENWDILNYPISLGLYHNQVEAYLNAFRHVKTVLLDDLKNNPSQVLNEIYDFLDVDMIDQIETTKTKKVFNESRAPKSKFLHRILNNPPRFVNVTKRVLKNILPKGFFHRIKKSLLEKNHTMQKSMNAKTRKKLMNYFKEDILKTQNLIKKDLSHWVEN